MRSKKGQIELVAIVAFVVLILIAVFFLLQPSGNQLDPWMNMLSDEQRLIRDSVKNFLSLATEEELTRLYEQGGFIDTTGTVNIKFSGLEIPLWVACGSVNVPDIENELSRGINEYIVRNLEKDTEFYGKDTILDVSKLKTEIILQDKKVVAKFYIPATTKGFEMPPEYEVTVDSNLKEILELSSNLAYELNETKFLELITMMAMTQSNRSSESWTPVKGVLTECGKRVVVKRPQFLEATKRMIKYIIKHLVWNREAPRLADNIFFQLDSTGGKSYDIDVSFHYPEEWDDELPEKFSTNPETLRKISKPLIKFVPFCMENYEVSYSFQYPVVIAVKDDIMNQHFRFAVYASIKDNTPDNECEAKLFVGRTEYETKCIDNAKCDFKIRVTDTNGNPIKDADVTFYECDLGYTNEAGLLISDTVKVPCMMSEIVVRKDGFMSNGTFVTPENLTDYEVRLQKIKSNLTVRYFGVPVIGINRNSEGWFEKFIPADQIFEIDNLWSSAYTGHDSQRFKLEAKLMWEPIEPNVFTEEDSDFILDNRDEDNNLVHEKNESIIHPIIYKVSGIVSDTERDDAILGYINQEITIEELDEEICVYFPVVVGYFNYPYTALPELTESVRKDQAVALQERLINSGIPFLIGQCENYIITACGDGDCQEDETCDPGGPGGSIECPGKGPLQPEIDCRITCNYCGDTIWDLGWEECDSMEEKYSSCNYGEPFNILTDCGLGTSEDNQYWCNSTCNQDGGWCGDTIIQDGNQPGDYPQNYGEQCDFGTDINCCESCHWVCSESDWDSYGPLKFGPASTDNYAILFDDERTVFELPACRILGSGTIDAELIQSDEKSAIIFVTDTSQSINEDLAAIKRAINDSIDALHIAADSGVDINVGLVRFSSTVTSYPIIGIADQNNAETLKNVVSSYSAGESTYTKDAITEARNLLNSYKAANQSQSNIIILLSDGQPTTAPDQNPSGVAGQAKTTDRIEIYTIAFTTETPLQTAMCLWSSDNGANCYTDRYSYTGTDASTTYEKITNDLKGLPQGDVNITIGTTKSSFDASGILNDISVDLSGLACSDDKQIIEFLSTEFKGRGSIKYSDFRIEYCDACNPNS
ncbi:MAG: VWA domain-containing protein [Candidatus Aenigmarchaeota archaeon]|nr:VWA domain-containing protein [Candidatus Aenigmarchaeota archaeon]